MTTKHTDRPRAGRGRGTTRTATTAPSTSDPFFDVVKDHWESIVHTFQQFADKHPVILFDVQEQRIYAYPYDDFRADLTAKDQRAIVQPYKNVVAGKTILVFVRDNEQRKLVSFSVDREDE